MNNILIASASLSILILVSACAHNPPVNSYTPACYDKIIKVWDKNLNKWVNRKESVCTIGNIY